MITFTFMSLATSVKDYVEITHKLISVEPLKNYTEFGAIFTYFIFSIGDFLKNFFSFSLLKNIWSIPIIIPDIASAMISEVSVLDGYFHNAFTFLETNVNTGTNTNLVIFEKFIIGLINSIFLILPTSTSHLITLRRFVMQGLEAGYLAGLGTLAGNFLWLASIILGWRFFVIPWLSLDIFRYLLGFILLVKYIWDSSKERRMVLEDLSKWKIFLLNFLLALTEQSCIYPFISNLSIGPDASILEGFPVENYGQFIAIHGAYLLGILLGSFSLLQFTCWFWENPAFSIYLWITTKASNTSVGSKDKLSTSSYYKILNFTFLYATMLCAIASIPYYGLDYTITNPIGLVPQDRILDQKKSQSNPDKLITETAFLNINPTDKNARIRDGVHARRERWKQRLIKYQAFDASMYDQGVYDFLTIEDLNYGFDRFWLRRKMRNHQIRFRLFPGPWMRSLKKQLNNPAPSGNATSEKSTKSTTGPRVEFFRILFEQFYHPNFHQSVGKQSTSLQNEVKLRDMKNGTQMTLGNLKADSDKAAFQTVQSTTPLLLGSQVGSIGLSNTLNKMKLNVKPGLVYSNSALRKFVRNVNTRINLKLLTNKQNNLTNKYNSEFIYSKRWKSLFAKLQPFTKSQNYQNYRNLSKQLLLTNSSLRSSPRITSCTTSWCSSSLKLTTINQKLSAKERKLLTLQTQYNQLKTNQSQNKLMLLRPLNVYLQKEQAFKRKLRYYGATPLRKLTVGNQAPYFKALMKRGFYYYKPSLRWKKTLYVASMRRGFRKKSRKQRMFIPDSNVAVSTNSTLPILSQTQTSTTLPVQTLGVDSNTQITLPTHSYTVLGKRASRYRHQIYKDVLQHWYYTPFNRLLMKFDVDAFINRQPKAHFLTKNEERLLHLRRVLLSEHYDTLRWYTYMQHYKTMKTNIGGTKSFANRVYNQQFQGTFKKIRHLFAITPKQGDFYTLKFDQPLYNDNKIKENVYLHEELLTDNFVALNQSSNTVDSMNSQSSNFGAFDSSKIADGTRLNPPFGSSIDQVLMQNALKTNIEAKIKTNNLNSNLTKTSNEPTSELVYNELFVKLIKECKKRIHDQTFLKHYITHCIEKREKLNEEQTKELNKRLEKLKLWLTNEPNVNKNNSVASTANDLRVATTGIQKAVNDSILISVTARRDSKAAADQPVTTKTTYTELDNMATLKQEDAILTKLNVINTLITQNQNSRSVTEILQTTINKTKVIPKLKQTILKARASMRDKTQLFKTRTDKNLEWWRKKQRVITKRKNSRKRDRFKKQKAAVEKRIKEMEKMDTYAYGGTKNSEISNYLINRVPLTDTAQLRKKQDNSAQKINNFNDNNLPLIWKGKLLFELRKKLSSKGRRYRALPLARYSTATRKPRLVGLTDKTKIDNISNLNGSFLTKEEKQEAVNNIILNDITLTDALKKSQIKKRSRHSWKKRARHQFNRNHYKYRKRRIHGNGKLRVMSKKMKKLKATNELRQWWWTSFLPRYLNNLETSSSTVKALDSLNNKEKLIVTQKYKPLSNTDINTNNLNNSGYLIDNLQSSSKISSNSLQTSTALPGVEKMLSEANVEQKEIKTIINESVTTTSLPFYAGWDESLRKFVVTNRLLSRRDSGKFVLKDNINAPIAQKVEFTNAPIQGLNEGSFLYWQTDMPFNAYNIDQFITTNQSFYAPLGWRRFEFRHSILKNWVNSSTLNQESSTLLTGTSLNSTPTDLTSKKTILVSPRVSFSKSHIKTLKEAKKTNKLVARRIKKRYKLLKQMPNQLMYSPTGPLLTQVLPSHYISVFDQQYRFPRNRYLKRNPLKTIKKTTLLTMIDSANQTPGITKDFTLRKRVKPRRKYHRKRFIKKDGLIFPRRTKFTQASINSDDDLRWRPSSRTKQKRKESVRSKTKLNKRVKTNPLRLRQLRRREFQQVLKPTQRYVPQNGGFTWPGDYLRLEVVEMPKLKTTNIKQTNTSTKPKLVQPVGIMPRKYLIEKHNIKVLKKKLEKAYSSHQFSKTLTEYKNLIQRIP